MSDVCMMRATFAVPAGSEAFAPQTRDAAAASAPPALARGSLEMRARGANGSEAMEGTNALSSSAVRRSVNCCDMFLFSTRRHGYTCFASMLVLFFMLRVFKSYFVHWTLYANAGDVLGFILLIVYCVLFAGLLPIMLLCNQITARDFVIACHASRLATVGVCVICLGSVYVDEDRSNAAAVAFLQIVEVFLSFGTLIELGLVTCSNNETAEQRSRQFHSR